jgi:NADH-quinone oxidoreductase subunit M
MTDTLLLSLIIFVPVLAAAPLALPAITDKMAKWITLVATIVVCALSLAALDRYIRADVHKATLMDRAAAARSANLDWDFIVRTPWITQFNIEYYLGVDGISLSLVVLTAVISLLAMMASFSIDKYVRGYCILFLLLETGMIGCFLALDFFLFYVFWEVMLLPMYFLIGVWGGPRREYAAIKFFLYTLLGSVFILIAMLGFYFTAGNTFDIMELQRLGQQSGGPFGPTFQLVMFVLLFVGFAIKVPIVPFHTWLPDAHVEAPTPISMILAGILLKMGGYGLIRIAYPICPQAAYSAANVVAIIGVLSIIYGAFAAMAQTDFKRLVAYSSVSHMGYVLLGLAVMRGLDSYHYSWGVNGAMFQMIAHGISSPGMFFLVGVIYERAHHRDLNRFGGLMNIMPIYGGISVVIFFAAMGLPGLCGFVGEVATVLAGYKYNVTMGVIAALGVILTAGYILWTVQRVYLGSNPQYEGTPDITRWEQATVVPLVVLAIALGVYPDLLLHWMGPDVQVVVDQLTGVATRMADLASVALQ